MRPSLPLAVIVLVAVAVVFALMVIAGIGGDVAATTAPMVTTIILQDTISPTGPPTTTAPTSTTTRPTSTTTAPTSTTTRPTSTTAQ